MAPGWRRDGAGTNGCSATYGQHSTSVEIMRPRARWWLLASLVAVSCRPLTIATAPAPATASAVTRVDGRVLSAAQVTDTVERLMREAHVTGLGVAIINHGRVAYQRAFGFRDAARALPFTDTTATYAASLTKAMFAHAVALLAADGRIDLDRPIARYLPQPLSAYEKYAELAAHPWHERFTLRILLNHTSGMPNFRFLNPDGRLDIRFVPGSRYAYSGEGINLAQFVLENGVGVDVDSLMRARIFAPAGMTRTAMTWRPEFEGDHALPHDSNGAALALRRRTGVRAAGSATTTLADIARYAAWFTRDDGVSPAVRTAITQPQLRIRSLHQFPTLDTTTTTRDDAIALAYGLGVGLFTSPHGAAHFKEGHDDGWANYMVTFEQAGVGLVLLSNSDNAERIFPALLEALIGDRWSPVAWEQWGPRRP